MKWRSAIRPSWNFWALKIEQDIAHHGAAAVEQQAREFLKRWDLPGRDRSQTAWKDWENASTTVLYFEALAVFASLGEGFVDQAVAEHGIESVLRQADDVILRYDATTVVFSRFDELHQAAIASFVRDAVWQLAEERSQ